MWVIALAALAAVSGLLWYRTVGGRRYRLDILALVSGGATVMFLIDSLYSYASEGAFIELSAEALQLSTILILAAIAVWIVALAIDRISRR